MSCGDAWSTYTAGVLAGLASAQHVVHDAPGSRRPVRVLALLVVPDLHGDLLQDVWLGPILPEAAPPDHGGRLAHTRRASKRLKADWTHIRHLRYFICQSDDSHVLQESYFILEKRWLPCAGSVG